jgi:hypothetical protein
MRMEAPGLKRPGSRAMAEILVSGAVEWHFAFVVTTVALDD